jgi:hypothetical protein
VRTSSTFPALLPSHLSSRLLTGSFDSAREDQQLREDDEDDEEYSDDEEEYEEYEELVRVLPLFLPRREEMLIRVCYRKSTRETRRFSMRTCRKGSSSRDGRWQT